MSSPSTTSVALHKRKTVRLAKSTDGEDQQPITHNKAETEKADADHLLLLNWCQWSRADAETQGDGVDV